MKKRYIIMPAVVIAAALVISVLAVVYTTNFMTYCEQEKNSYDESLYDWEKMIKYAEIRYSVEPNDNSLSDLCELYNPVTLLYRQNNGEELSDEYFLNAAEYCRAKFEAYQKKTAEINREQDDWTNGNLFTEECWAFSDYAWLLWLGGEQEKAKEETEQYIRSIESGISYAEDLRGFFAYVYNYGDEESAAWVLEKEEYIVDCINENRLSDTFGSAAFGSAANESNSNEDMLTVDWVFGNTRYEYYFGELEEKGNGA